MQYTSYYKSSLGKILLASNGTSLTGLWFVGQKYYADTLENEHTEKNLEILDMTRDWLNTYFQGKNPGQIPPVDLKSSEFRIAVWNILMDIPYGKVMTYGEIASKIAKQKGITHMSAQAVGGAVGHNPISIIIPCHRVVGTNGSLTGYAVGVTTKESLLLMEGIDMNQYYIPKKGTAL